MPNGQLFPEITLMAPNAGYDPLRATAGVYIEQWMRQLGMPVTAELTNFNNILTAVYTSGDYDIFILGWGLTSFPGYLCDFFYNGVGADNPYGYESPTLQEQCNAFFTEPDLAAAQVIADELQVTIATELPYITLFTNPIYDAFRNIDYPYTQTFDGLGAGLYGAPLLTWSVAQ
jgi:peptide/nickel transport system substrate-binding protein